MIINDPTNYPTGSKALVYVTWDKYVATTSLPTTRPRQQPQG